jgi:hypothetical protein
MNSTLAFENLPPVESEGWSLTCIERDSRYWLTAQVGRKDGELFEQGVKASWQWAKGCKFVGRFSDGERRYAQELWKLASLRLRYQEVSAQYRHLKVAARGTRSSY